MTRTRRFFSLGNIRTQLLLCLALSAVFSALSNPLQFLIEWLADIKLLSDAVAGFLRRIPLWLDAGVLLALQINLSRLSARLFHKLFPRVRSLWVWTWGVASLLSLNVLPLLTAGCFLIRRRRWGLASLAVLPFVFFLIEIDQSVFWFLSCSLFLYFGTAILYWKLPISGRRPGRAILIAVAIAGIVEFIFLTFNLAIATGGVAAFREMDEHFGKATRTEVEAREKGGVSAALPLWRELAATESNPEFKPFRILEYRLPGRQAQFQPKPKIRELLNRLETLLKHRPAILQYHYDREMDPEPPSDALPAISLAANAFARRAATAAGKGDWKSSANDLAALEQLSELAGNSFGKTAYLYRLACLRARLRVINSLLADPKVPDEVLVDWRRQLQTELAKQPEQFRKMLRDQYIRSYETILAIMTAQSKINPSEYQPYIRRLEFYLICRSLRKAVYLDTLTEPEILKRLAAYQEKRDKIPDMLSQARRLVFKWEYFRLALIRRSDLRSALAGIAIEEYRRKYGKRPDSLEALSPEFLESDFFSPEYCLLKLEPASFEQKIDDRNYHLTGIRIVNPALKRDFNIVDHVEEIK